MSIESTRPHFWRSPRRRIDGWYDRLPLPAVNPDLISLGSLVLAVMFLISLWYGQTTLAWIVLLIHLFFDGLDGAVARRHGTRKTSAEHNHGLFVDLTVDRIAEGLLFLWPAFQLPWLPLFFVNVVLAVLSFIFRRALVQPLRFVFFLVFTFNLLRPWITSYF